MNFYDVPYAPGRLEAVGYTAGKAVSRDVVETTGKAVALKLTPDRTALKGDGVDAMPITVAAVDAKGRVVPDAMDVVSFAVDGAERLGIGNGDPNSLEADAADKRSLFHGLAQLVIRSHEGAGQAVITATADGLKPAKLTLAVTAAEAPKYQATLPGGVKS
jgi:beta-galactosidase